MDGLMMDRPLLVSSLIEHAATYHGDTEIVSRTVEGPIHRTTYAEAERRAKRVANALTRLGIRPGDRVATLAWNGYRHFELYFGISGIGAVCHTINPRLFHEQIEYIVNHAEDRVLFVDLTFVPLVEKLAEKLKPIRHIVIMTDAAHMPPTSLPDALCYETLIAAETDALAWPEFDERRACSMCYTSGTTGNPKAALYSHRSTILHTFAVCSADAIGFSSLDTICPIVPMFHANAWGVPYAATMVGREARLPRAQALDGPSLCALFEAEGVSLTLGVPTVWLGMLKEMEARGRKPPRLERLLVGGSAAPHAMIETFETKYGVTVMHGWGMTEMSPVGTVGTMKGKHRDLPIAEKIAIKAMQGRPMYGVEMKIVDAEGRRLPHDGVSAGELLVRGPWIVSGYFNDDEASAAALDARGVVSHRRHVRDRSRRLSTYHRPGEGRDQVGRRVDLVDRRRERRHGPSRRRRGGGDRPAASEMERTPALDRRAEGGEEPEQGGPPGVSRRTHGEVDAAGRRGLHRGAAAHGDRQALEDEAARDLPRPPAADRRRGGHLSRRERSRRAAGRDRVRGRVCWTEVKRGVGTRSAVDDVTPHPDGALAPSRPLPSGEVGARHQ